MKSLLALFITGLLLVGCATDPEISKYKPLKLNPMNYVTTVIQKKLTCQKMSN